MTVITKPLSDKKNDKLDEPLVQNIHTEFPEVHNQQDVERAATAPFPPTGDPKLLVIRPHARRSSSATTVCLFLTAMLVMTCGIIAGVYLYRQFALAQMHRFRGWCRFPYDEAGTNAMYFGSKMEQEDMKDINARINEDIGLIEKLAGKAYKSQTKETGENGNFIKEEVEIGTEDESYEKITVPTFIGGKHSRFIHDFNSNKSGIIDLDENRCFVMPLNRSQVLPPRSMMDLVQKMWTGYYEVDTSVLRQTMRVVLPPVQDVSQMGRYIQKECEGLPTYRLEKIVSGVFKRSIPSEQGVFTAFTGKMTSFDILNMDEVLKYENEHLPAVENQH